MSFGDHISGQNTDRGLVHQSVKYFEHHDGLTDTWFTNNHEILVRTASGYSIHNLLTRGIQMDITPQIVGKCPVREDDPRFSRYIKI